MVMGSLVLLTSCIEIPSYDTVNDEALVKEGEKLIAEQCYVCHVPPGGDNRTAPPMMMVKNHYVDDETTREEFVQSVMDWVNSPSEDRARMHGAIRNWGLMPQQNVEEKDLKAIATYIFETDFE